MKNRDLSPTERAHHLKKLDDLLEALDGEECLYKLQLVAQMTGVMIQHMLIHHLDSKEEADKIRPELLRVVMTDMKNGMGLANEVTAHRKPEGALPSTPSFLGTPPKPLIH